MTDNQPNPNKKAMQYFILNTPKLFQNKFNLPLRVYYDPFQGCPVSERLDKEPLTKEQWEYLDALEEGYILAMQAQKE